MASSAIAFQQANCSAERTSKSFNLGQLKTSLSTAFKPFLKKIQQVPLRIDLPSSIKNTSVSIVDAFVDLVFEFVDQPVLPSQANFAPVDEIGEAVKISIIEGKIPDSFPEGVYIRNGPNPLFGGFKSTLSIFGRSSHIWVEGEGMLHALYFTKEDGDGNWTISYRNKHVETETFELEKRRNKPSFIPTVEGDSPAILSAYFFNWLRFGKVNKLISNTNVFKHAGKLYSVAENDLPQEVDIFLLKTLCDWDVNGAWNRPFTSHPKTAPGTGELVVVGADAKRPFLVLGVISADGKELIHKVDLKFNRCSLCHENGITENYNVIIDWGLSIDINRVVKGGPLMRYDKEGCARIGVMPRYGNADSIRWFKVKANCTFHIFNCFEDGDEVIVRGCRALQSIIPGPDFGLNKFEWFSKGFENRNSTDKTEGSSAKTAEFFTHAYEWRLNIKNGDVVERSLTGDEFSMDFPMINEQFTGYRNKYGYSQLVDSTASSTSGMAKYGGIAKLYFDEPDIHAFTGRYDEVVRVEYHMFPKATFCSGAAFVPKGGGLEDDGWIITYVHHEDTNISQVYIIDTKNLSSEPIAKLTLPQRVPYGFHGAFIPSH